MGMGNPGLFLLLFLSASLALAAGADPGCETSSAGNPPAIRSLASVRLPVYSQAELRKLWKGGKNDRKKVTGNAAHFWAWSRNNADKYLKDYLDAGGVILGDPHTGNVFDYRPKGKPASLAVSDVDDGGEGPLFLDFARFVVFTESGKPKLKIQDVFDAYVEGLKGKKGEIPGLLAEAREYSAADIEKKHQKYIEKHTQEDGQLDLEDLDLNSRVSAEKKDRMDSLAEDALKRAGAKKIWGEGFREDKGGASAGADRYWVLVGGEKEAARLYEYKEQRRPATSFYQEQKANNERIAKVEEIYSEEGLDSHLFGVVKAGADFRVRPRHYQILSPDEEDKSDKEDFTYYVANWIGRAQAKQAGGKKLRKMIEEDPEAAKDALKKFVRAYEEEMEELGD